jgi:lysophospholipase L1-like esterase
MYIRDPELYHVLAPNLSVEFSSTDWVTHVNTNQLGFRDREVSPKGPYTFRILVLGDSYTFGYGVEMEDSYPEQLEGFLNVQAQQPREYDVINTGVNGYGTIQEFGLLKRHFDSLRPDLVLLGFFTGNDFRNNLTFTEQFTPKFTGAGRWLADHIRLLGRLESFIKGAEEKWRVVTMGIDLTLEVIENIAQFCQERDTPFAIVIITPSPTVLKKYYAHNFLHLAFDRALGYQPLQQIHTLKERIRALDILALDTLDFLQTVEVQDDLSFPVDGHWTALGNRLVAREIRDWPVQKNLVPKEHIGILKHGLPPAQS